MKERLIGAAVLVAVGVWIIPWVLDGRQDPLPPSAATLELPAPNDAAPIRTETLRLDREANASALTPAIPTPRVVPAAEPEARSAPSSPTASTPAPELNAAQTTRPAAATAATDDPAPAAESEPRLAAKPSAPPAPGPGWLVQLGSFGEEENARRLAARVKTYGYAAEVAPFRSGGRVMHRVRLGPEPSRAQAEALAASLGAHGFVAQVLPSE